MPDIKYVAGKQIYLLANLYNPAAYEWTGLNCSKIIASQSGIYTLKPLPSYAEDFYPVLSGK